MLACVKAKQIAGLPIGDLKDIGLVDLVGFFLARLADHESSPRQLPELTCPDGWLNKPVTCQI